MKNYLKICFYGITLIGLLVSCKKEAALEPSVIKLEYSLPQGNHAYDSRIVNFYQTYKTFILYQFTDADFRWNFNGNISYVAQQADPAHVETALNFFDKELFAYYSPELLKTMLPYKILLCKKIEYTMNTEETPVYSDVASTQTHIAFSNVDAGWDSFSTARKIKARGQLHGVLWSSAVARGKMEQAPAFIEGINYSYVGSWNYKSFGMFNPTSVAADDIFDYVSRITSHTKEAFEAEYLNADFDPTGVYRRRYEALLAYYKTKYNLDLQAIGNANLH
ncbi:hypothetical protein [Sphingobacterium sp.]|uniref:hypothetical protein n=1 Tax=Sphingobacterium sp. TaxID=341027 RepID=UPI0031D7C868